MTLYLTLLIIIALTLACTAAVQFYYLLFLESANRQHKRRIAELERETLKLSCALEQTATQLEHELASNREDWPEVVNGDDDYSVG